MDSTLQKTILLVEDEALIAITQKMTLQHDGYSVVTATSGEEAIEIALNNDSVDLVLMDIDLGRGMRGTEAAEIILRQRDLPLAFLSSHTEPEIVDMTEGITSYGYIVKNSGNTVLLASIRMAFKLHEAHAKLLERKEHLDTALAREEHVNELLSEKTDELERYFSTSLDMLCIANTKGEFVRLNPEWEKTLGFSIDELKGRQLLEFVHPDDRDSTVRTLAQLADQEDILNFENRYRCKDGSYRWIEWRSRPVESAIYAAARDITDRKLTEDALRDNEMMFRTLMENSIDAVQLLDENGRFLAVNKVACEMTGYTRDELLTMRIADIDPNYPDEGFLTFWRQKPKGTSILFETIHRHKSGRLIPVEVNGIFFELKDRKLLFGVSRDITGRRNADRALQEQTTLQHLLMTIAAEMIDVPLDSVDDRIDWMLAELGRLNAFDRVFLFRNAFERGVTTNTHEWCAPGITSEIGNLQAVPLEEVPRIMETHAKGEAFIVPRASDLPEGDSVRALMDAQGIKSTLLFPLMKDGVNTGFIGFDAVREERTVSDSLFELLRFTAKLLANIETHRASEQRHSDAERSIRENEERFRGLLDGIKGVPVQGIGADGVVHYWNLASEELYGHRAEDAIGGNIVELLIPPELKETITERIRRMAESGQPGPATEDWLVRNDGTRVLVRTAHAIVQLPGKDVELFSIDQDVTEQRKIEDGVRKLAGDRELMLKEVQHRIKNTLHTMGSLLSLHARTIKNPEAVAALEDAQSRFGSIKVLYDQLYRADDHSSGSVRRYLVQLIERVAALFPSGDTVKLETEIDDLALDAKRLSPLGMIVNELVTNAMKYAFSGHTDPKLSVTGRRSGDRYTLVVSDNGPGLPRSFDPSTSSSFGLAMIGALTDQLRGTVRFENDNGTRVRLEFPFS